MNHPRYILSKRIARGGMAEIYLGKQVGEEGFARICAIKRILPHYAQEQEFVEMFRDEAHICKRLQHANIVRVEGFEEVEGSYAIIMELVNGADLRTLLAACEKSGHRIPPAIACYIIAEAARGLHYAHTKIDEVSGKALEIVHRDISPQNLLLSFEGEVKVTDFGIADSDNKMTETKPGIVKGKYAYMSPEQISGKPVDAKTDVFALSIILWEMLTMRRLFHGDNEVETINLVRACKIPSPLSQFNREVSQGLEDIVLKGLAKDKKMRFQSASDLEVALRVFLNQNYPSFTPKDISQLMRLVLSKKINESQEDIKRVLTENNKLPNQSANKVPQQAQINERLSNAIGHGHHVIDVGPINYGGKPGQGTNAGQFSISNATNTRSKLAVAPRSHYSSTSRNSASTNSSNPYTIANRRKKSKGSFKTFAIAICAALAIFGSINWIVQAKRQPALFLQTTPPTVKVYYNQSALFNGAYVSSPILVHEIPEGKGTVTIMREGYEAYRFNVDYKKGRRINNESIVLKQTGKFSPVKIMSKPSSESAEVIINDGFIKGTAPLNAQDLAYGKSHEIKVIPKSDGKAAFTCRFTPTSVDFLDPYILGLDLNKRQCFQIKK